ncbi:MAG: F0F1 ATP synthase subunit B [Mycoplasmataceae bacterium]|nr:F0F1 ATP synthase subunit B [Mycoplasmataceae bacterium]
MNKQLKKLIIFLISGIVLFLPLCLTLTSCQPIASSDVVNDLLPNVWVFLSHVFATVVLLILIIWLVWKPTKKSLAKRREYIANEIAEAEKAKREAFEKLTKAQQEKVKAHEQAKIIVDNATSQAYVKKEAIESEGKNNAKKIVEDAKLSATQLHQSLKENNEKQIMDIAFSATEALLNKNIDDEENKKIVNDFIKKLNKGAA